ncbi:chemotaxis protein CheA [Paenibacillus alkalitolerans]|uniref:chemotaxis protein CheA n=1 Tax=Paenibacillus alkalitolerans TaxID=2799335 RepID=UPI0018F70DB2|nr:chemotaxis protein CheA [Paenibacillus alkalitolerans]
MTESIKREPMFEMFLYESFQLIEQLEQTVLDIERSGHLAADQINLIFRIMHTIKGSAAVMMYNQISDLAHYTEDLFHYLRDNASTGVDHTQLVDLVLSVSDSMKSELQKIDRREAAKGNFEELIQDIKSFISRLKQDVQDDAPEPAERHQICLNVPVESARSCGSNGFEARLKFMEDCGMENIRCYSVIHNLKEIAEIHSYVPEDIIVNHESSTEFIKANGFTIRFSSEQGYNELLDFFSGTSFISQVGLVEQEQQAETADIEERDLSIAETNSSPGTTKQNHFISVNVEKMDKLMDLVGELVISEAMVTEHPELKGIQLERFTKAARQLRKITGELQDVVMTIRMVPLSATFQKMNRIVRDMSKKLDKEVQLNIAGQETEVDKSIIEQLSDPLMHMIRNCIDHGIETADERRSAGKPGTGTVWLEAKNAGGEVWITIRDDGRGLDKDKILQKAKAAGLLLKSETDYTDREIYSMIFLPGFSTKEAVTEFSGRGVGMDVVNRNIQALGGTVHVESSPGRGTTTIVKIPLTLAIIDGMTVKVGDSRFTVPTVSIRESFRVSKDEVIRDPEGNEMILIRGTCYKIVRMYERYRLQTRVTDLEKGIVLMVEYEELAVCIFADELLGKQQVVVKSLPPVLKKIGGISGCTLLGDGSISLILDISDLLMKTD